MKYDVVFTRFGCANVEADSYQEAMKIANELKVDEVTWSDDWKPTDAISEG